MRDRNAFVTAAATLLLILTLPPALSAQTGNIVGTVTDAQSGAAVTGAVLSPWPTARGNRANTGRAGG